MEEIWKDVPGYEGLYQASSFGNIKSLGRTITESWSDGSHFRTRTLPAKVLKSRTDTNGYLSVSLHPDAGSFKRIRIHRIILLTFMPTEDKKLLVNHKDEDKTNNHINNLEWCDLKYNLNYGDRVKKYRKSRGKRVDRFTLDDVYIDTWDSMTYASELIYNTKNKETDIRKNCLGKSKYVLNYKWRFTNES